MDADDFPTVTGRDAIPQGQDTTNLPRRSLLTSSALAAFTIAAPATPALAKEPDPISQPSPPTPKSFMARAYEMRDAGVKLGDRPYGAVIVQGNRVVGQSWSRVVLDTDPSAHAEMAAIRDAARRLGRARLNGCILYASSRPCPMCEAAAYWAGIDGMVHGRGLTDAGAPRLCR